MQTLYQIQAIRQCEQRAIAEYGITENDMMAKAGHAAFTALQVRWPKITSLAVFCGKGNNGGDGYIVAQLAKAAGLAVAVYSLCAPEDLTGAAKTAMLACKNAGVDILPFKANLNMDVDMIVDAVLGIGVTGEVRGAALDAINTINRANKPVLAIDIPSGLHGDTGQRLGSAVNAALTITFIGLKQGMVTGEAPSHCGDIIVDTIGLPEKLFATVEKSGDLIHFDDLKQHLLPRKRTAHKGDFGHVLIIGGDNGMGGAVHLAGQAALRTGAGLVSVITRKAHIPDLLPKQPELMFHGTDNPETESALLERATVIVIGPGLGQSDWSRACLALALQSNCPKVLDADALNLLAKKPMKHADWVLTPHPGEAARLLGTDTNSINRNRFQSAQAIQKHYGGIVVLKGAGSLIVDDNALAVCAEGNPGMATAGMGDVLSGIIGALMAQQVKSTRAVRLGVCLHAHAADIAAQSGERGLVASDVIATLRGLVNPPVL